ncbi:MAG: PAS domain S-box protein, partial [Desulfobulbaceae bacterium]|nr:PAS domain S-box protein [Desulfobulbaceae bacterium]
MLPFRDLNIRKKLTLFLMGTITFAVLLVGFGLYALLINQYQHLYQSDLDGLAMVLAANCDQAIIRQNISEAQTILSSLGARPSITLAAIYGMEGKLFAAYQSSPENFVLAPETVDISRPIPWNIFPGMLQASRKIKQGDEVIGTLILVDDMRTINSFRIMVMLTLVIIIVLVLSSSSVVAAQFRELISKPISELATLSHRVSETRDYSLRAVKYGSDEVGELVDEFNNMLERISERTNELQEREQLFRNVINQAADAIFLHDTTGRLIDVNERACCSLGYTREELLTMNIIDIAPRSYSGESPEKYWNLPCSEPAITLEGVHQCKNGFSFPVEVKMGTMNMGDRHLIISVARDITERLNIEEEKRKLETQLQQAQKMESIGTLASGIAHDFNNILSPIFGYIELTMVEMDEKHRFRPYLKEVYQAAERAKELVKQILTFSREE